MGFISKIFQEEKNDEQIITFITPCPHFLALQK